MAIAVQWHRAGCEGYQAVQGDRGGTGMSAIRVEGVPGIIPCSDGSLTLQIPIRIRRRSGCKKITLSSGENGMPHKPSRIMAMQRALARGHYWLAMLESGEVKALRELAVREGRQALMIAPPCRSV